MTGLLSSEIISVFQHIFKNITIPDFCFLYMNALFFTHQTESQIRHHGDNNGVLCKFSVFFQEISANRHDLISIYQLSVFIYSKHTIRISVKCNTDICLFGNNSCTQFVHMGRTTIGINVRSIWIGMNSDQICPQIFQRLNRSIGTCAFCTVHNDLQRRQIYRNRLFLKRNILIHNIKPILNPADSRSDRKNNVFHIIPDQCLDFVLQLIG